jgi:hypothetical protein
MLLLLGSSPASASILTIFNDLGAGQSHLSTGYSLGQTYNFTQGVRIVPAVTSELYEIDLALGYMYAAPNDVIVTLLTDESGKPGSTILEQFTITGLAPNSSGGSVKTVQSTRNPLLLAGTAYWLSAANAAGSSGYVRWYLANSGSGIMDNTYNGPWQTPQVRSLPALEILGTDAPEPATAAAVVLGFTALAVWRFLMRRRDRSSQ